MAWGACSRDAAEVLVDDQHLAASIGLVVEGMHLARSRELGAVVFEGVLAQAVEYHGA